jgi:hypothetical protein
MNPSGFIYFADLFCPACAAGLPDVDPEGNRKGPFYSIQESDAPCNCGKCGAFISSTLTEWGGRELAARIREENQNLPAPLPPVVAEWAEAHLWAEGVRDALDEREAFDLTPPRLVKGFVYELTTLQRLALIRTAARWRVDVAALVADAYPEPGNPATACLMVPIPGRSIVLGVERDGHVHS